jgi:hypothetical protein
MPLRQMNVLIPEDEFERVKKTAKAKGISVAEYVRRAIALQFAYELSLERGREQPPQPRDEGT